MNKNWQLKVFSLYIHPFDLEKLANPLKLFDDLVPANLIIKDNEFKIFTKFRGHQTRNLPKRSYFIKFKKTERLISAQEFHLNAEYNDPSFIRNKISLDLFKSFGILSPISQHIKLYLNGKYEGIYLQLESVDDLFLKKRNLPTGSIFYAINIDADFSFISPITEEVKVSLTNGYERKLGNVSDEEYLVEFISKINHLSMDDFELEISKYLSVEKYLRWLAVAVCTQNIDGFNKNYALYRNNQTGLFELIPWDYDATFGRDWNGEIVSYDALSIKGDNILTKKLLEIPNFRKQYKLLLKELLDTLFTPTYLEPKLLSLNERLRPHLQFTLPEQMEQFDFEKEYILQFIKNRNNYLRNNLTQLD